MNRTAAAITDAVKLLEFDCRRAILIYGFEYPSRPLEPAVKTVELLLSARVAISKRFEASFDGLMHPIHSSGRVIAWEVLGALR